MPDEAGEAGNENFSSLLAIPQVSSIPSLSSSRKEGRKRGKGEREGERKEKKIANRPQFKTLNNTEKSWKWLLLVFFFPQWVRKVWHESSFSMKILTVVGSYETVPSISFLLRNENTEFEHIYIFSLPPFLSLSLPVCVCIFSFLPFFEYKDKNYAWYTQRKS